jgi:sugar lactone lactonase YvrE
MRALILAGILALGSTAEAQRTVTVAGLGPNHRAEVDGRPALDAPLDSVYGLLLSRSGRLLFHDETLVERLEPDGTLLALVGAINRNAGSMADGTPASALRIGVLRGMAEDASGALYLSDAGAGRVYRVDTDGLVTTVATVTSPRGLVFDSKGNLNIAETFCRCIRRLAPDGTLSTVYTLPSATEFRYFEGLALDSADNLYATEYAGDEVLRIAADGTPTILLDRSQVSGPSGVAVAADGTLYIADTKNDRVLKRAPDGTLATVAGAPFRRPAQVVIAPDGSLLVSDYGNRRVRRIGPDGSVTTVAGSGLLSAAASGANGDGGPALYATLFGPSAAVFDGAGNLLIAETTGGRIRRIAPDGTISTVATVPTPFGLAIDAMGAIYVASGDSRVRRIDAGGIAVIAGKGTGSGLNRSQGDGGSATEATLNEPRGIAVDAGGNVYIADTGNARLRVVARDGIIRTLAGPGQQGSDYWSAVALDRQGAVYVATTRAAAPPPGPSSAVSRVNADSSLTEVAGGLHVALALPVDPRGDVYVVDSIPGVVMRLDGTTVARETGVTGAAFDRDGNLFLVAINSIREVTSAPLVPKLSRDRLDFPAAGSQTVLVTTNFAEPYPYTVTIAGGAWLSVNRAAALTGEAVSFTADNKGLAPGVYRATVTVRLLDATLELPVSLTVR